MRSSEYLKSHERVFLSLLRVALHGKSGVAPEDTDWKAVFQLAQKQNVLPMIVEAAYAWACPEHYWRRHRRRP